MKQKTMYEADDGTLFRSEETCKLYDAVRDEEKRKAAIEKCKKNIRSLQHDIDVLKGRIYTTGSSWKTSIFSHTIASVDDKRLKEREDFWIEESWKKATNFAESYGFPLNRMQASYNDMINHLTQNARSLNAAFLAYMYAKRAYETVLKKATERGTGVKNLAELGVAALMLSAAKQLMTFHRGDLAHYRKKIHSEKRRLQRLEKTKADDLRMGAETTKD